MKNKSRKQLQQYLQSSWIVFVENDLDRKVSFTLQYDENGNPGMIEYEVSKRCRRNA